MVVSLNCNKKISFIENYLYHNGSFTFCILLEDDNDSIRVRDN